MKTTYRAMQISKSGTLELVERPIQVPGPREVLIEVEACGICGADVGDIENPKSDLELPRVPGHEVVGRIVATGSGVNPYWMVGQRVGVGRLGGHCNHCEACRSGQFQLCREQPFVGSTQDGGYAEMMIARATGLVSIPDGLKSQVAAPILCAGIATFNALKKSGAQAGDVIAVHGVGGLGHMAIQYAHKMGFKVVAIGRGKAISQQAIGLGAHIYIDSNEEDAAERLQAMGGARAILSTTTSSSTIASLLPTLSPQGRIMLLGFSHEPLAVPFGPMIAGERSIMGSITGSPFENEKTLNFSMLSGVRPKIETMPLEKANEAYQKMRSGEVEFRMVLTM
ncbi:alcohol dehydrogenase catalytic domain-containing protein [Vibrio sp. F74]|uniref:alcohol dehydrogenase catalytic domain-containing protein n=1 Tax=Vibrio sp. F74 TaxID=700020 RepID=UPI0035F5958E